MPEDTLSYVLACLRRSSENSYPWSLTPNEAGLLVAEIERLREQRRIDNEEATRLYDFARDKGQALERAAVVAWLRQPSEHPDPTRTITMRADEWAKRVDAYADFIESGGHRNEEEK